VRKKLLRIDPFQSYPELVASFSFKKEDRVIRKKGGD
jgi:hypothetical protein